MAHLNPGQPAPVVSVEYSVYNKRDACRSEVMSGLKRVFKGSGGEVIEYLHTLYKIKAATCKGCTGMVWVVDYTLYIIGSSHYYQSCLKNYR